jgi:hypothetical protein
MLSRVNTEMNYKLANEDLWNKKFKDTVDPNAFEFIGQNKRDRKKFLFDIAKAAISESLPSLDRMRITNLNLIGFDSISANQFTFLFFLIRNSQVVYRNESTLTGFYGYFASCPKPPIFDEISHGNDDGYEMSIFVRRIDHNGQKIFAYVDFGSITGNQNRHKQIFFGHCDQFSLQICSFRTHHHCHVKFHQKLVA